MAVWRPRQNLYRCDPTRGNLDNRVLTAISSRDHGMDNGADLLARPFEIVAWRGIPVKGPLRFNLDQVSTGRLRALQVTYES